MPSCFLIRLVRPSVYRSGLERRCASGESEAFEDLSGDHCIFDGRKESEGGSAAGATKRVHLEHALEQRRPAVSSRCPACRRIARRLTLP